VAGKSWDLAQINEQDLGSVSLDEAMVNKTKEWFVKIWNS